MIDRYRGIFMFLTALGFVGFLVAMAWLRERTMQWFRDVDRQVQQRRRT